jgi:hypothetical protein
LKTPSGRSTDEIVYIPETKAYDVLEADGSGGGYSFGNPDFSFRLLTHDLIVGVNFSARRAVGEQARVRVVRGVGSAAHRLR